MSLSSHPELNHYFETPDLAQWKQLAEQALKGADFEKSLYSNTLEGIRIEPVYRADQTRNLDYGVLQNACQSVLFQTLPTDSVHAFKQALQVDQQSGLNGLHLDLNAMPQYTRADFNAIFAACQVSELPLLIQAPALSAIEWIGQELPQNPSARNIYLLSDPLAECLNQGQWRQEQDWQPLAKFVQQSQFKAVGINACVYHEAGAHALQELSYLLGHMLETLDQLEAQSCSPALVLSQMHVHLSLSQNLLMELAKLRAARILVQRITQAYHQPEITIPIFCHSSRVSLSQIDPHNNYLRQSLSALAALLGGASGIHIDTYQGSLDDSSRRMARNIYLVLRQESRLSQVLDPAGGSWALDQLTAELLEKAWANFLTQESQGGFLKQLQQGLPQAEIAQTARQRLTQVATRKQSLVGVNQYAGLNPIDAAQHETEPELPADSLGTWLASARLQQTTEPIVPLHPLRLAKSFEDIRLAVQAQAVSVRLLTLGSSKAYRARLEFSRAFFAIAGIHPAEASLVSASGELETLANLEADILVFCSSDELYQEHLSGLLPQLAQQYNKSKLILAGKANILGESASLLQGSIYLGCNVLDTFNTWIGTNS